MATHTVTQHAHTSGTPGFSSGVMSQPSLPPGAVNTSVNSSANLSGNPSGNSGDATILRSSMTSDLAGSTASGPATGLAPHGSAPDATSADETPSLRLTASFARLPVGLEVTVPVREFRVRNLLALVPGEVIETQWGHGDDLPLSSGDLQLAWSEFEVVDNRLAVRVTRLA